MEKEKSLSDLSGLIEQFATNNQINPKQLDKIQKALTTLSEKGHVPTKIETSRGGDMYEIDGSYKIQKKGSKAPATTYSEEDVKNLIEVIAGEIANNGKEIQKPPAERKWGKKLSAALVALMAVLIVLLQINLPSHKQKKTYLFLLLLGHGKKDLEYGIQFMRTLFFRTWTTR